MSDQFTQHRLRFALRAQAHQAAKSVESWKQMIADGKYQHKADGMVADALTGVSRDEFAACMSDVRYSYGNDAPKQEIHYSRHRFAFDLVARTEERELRESDVFLTVTERLLVASDLGSAESAELGRRLVEVGQQLRVNPYYTSITLGVSDLVSHLTNSVLCSGMKPLPCAIKNDGELLDLNVWGPGENGQDVVISMEYHMKRLLDLQGRVAELFDENGAVRH